MALSTKLIILYRGSQSPRWLLLNGSSEGAEEALRRFRSGTFTDEQIALKLDQQQLGLAVEVEKGRYVELFKPWKTGIVGVGSSLPRYVREALFAGHWPGLLQIRYQFYQVAGCGHSVRHEPYQREDPRARYLHPSGTRGFDRSKAIPVLSLCVQIPQPF